MRAAIVYEHNKPMEVAEVELTDLHDHDVLVRIEASGVCHSDVAVQTGALPFPIPIIVGHEGAGVVEEVGSAVTMVKVGDHVVLAATMLDELVTRRYTLDRVNDAVADMHSGANARGVVIM